MVKLNDVYKKNDDDWVSRLILDEAVIIPLCRSEEDMQHIYSISNDTGLRIWQLLDGEHSVRHIQKILESEYEGQAEAVEREVLEFFGDLLEVQLITKVQGKTESTKRKPSVEKKPKRGKKKYKTPEITKVKMEPEQAVLSCCSSAVGSMKIGVFGRVWCTYECPVLNCVIQAGDNHDAYDGVS